MAEVDIQEEGSRGQGARGPGGPGGQGAWGQGGQEARVQGPGGQEDRGPGTRGQGVPGAGAKTCPKVSKLGHFGAIFGRREPWAAQGVTGTGPRLQKSQKTHG